MNPVELRWIIAILGRVGMTVVALAIVVGLIGMVIVLWRKRGQL